jgi:hypothetical protein
MARNKLLRTERESEKVHHVYIRLTGQHVAVIYKNSGSRTYRYRLDNYPHRTSQTLDMDQCLERIEKEVL